MVTPPIDPANRNPTEMNPADMNPADMNDAQLAAHLAQAAGGILLAVRQSHAFTGKALGAAGDHIANQFLSEALRTLRPGDGLLSEETTETHAANQDRLRQSRVWIIDPVDGTREYGEARSDWAVHVGLSVDGVAVAGAVAQPGLESGLVMRSDRLCARIAHDGAPRLVVSRTRPATEAVAVAERIGGALLAMGSAGAKAMAVVRGDAEIYLHSGGQYEWDSCAPVAVALAHGMHCSRIDGTALEYNRSDTYLPDLLICIPSLADRVLAIVRETGAD